MLKVVIVGTGNVSHHLQRAFSQVESVDVLSVLPGRSDLSTAFSKSDPINKHLEKADVIIIAVNDDAIPAVAEQFNKTDKLLVHTSGSVSINSLPETVRSGVFYPIQTFSKERQVNFNTIPICVETKDKKDLELLKSLGLAIADNVHEINSKQRKALHLAAVFVNNFTNHLYQKGSEICEENNVSFDLLKPLIAETAAKIEHLSPEEAQTGPAKRDDRNTMKEHLSQIKTLKQREIYSLLTQSIRQTHGEKL